MTSLNTLTAATFTDTHVRDRLVVGTVAGAVTLTFISLYLFIGLPALLVHTAGTLGAVPAAIWAARTLHTRHDMRTEPLLAWLGVTLLLAVPLALAVTFCWWGALLSTAAVLTIRHPLRQRAARAAYDKDTDPCTAHPRDVWTTSGHQHEAGSPYQDTPVLIQGIVHDAAYSQRRNPAAYTYRIYHLSHGGPEHLWWPLERDAGTQDVGYYTHRSRDAEKVTGDQLGRRLVAAWVDPSYTTRP